MKKNWYRRNYRRNLIDMHIEDWNDAFLSKLNTETYISMLKKSNVQAAMVYANSHVGLCYWPTENGQMHLALKGNDFLGEMITKCHQENLDVIVYFTLIYDNWAYNQDEKWRTVNEDGHYSREKSESRLFSGQRYGICCPNSIGYRQYVLNQVEELCTKYDFEGMFLDMTFWSTVCYCPSCQSRYENEIGGDMPRVINWEDKKWLAFQKQRELWLTEFASEVSDHIKRIKPDVTVEHQYSTACFNWRRGVTIGINNASEYAGGDLYGGIAQQSFICKLYHNLTCNEPFEYMTSRCDPNLNYHTSTKSHQNMEIHNYITLAHNGAFLFIDAIDPDGTIHPALYEMMGKIFSKSMLYERYLGGELIRDVAIYFTFSSKMDPEGKSIKEEGLGGTYPHLNAALGAASTLMTYNIPFDIINKKNLCNIKDCQVLVIPDVYLLEDDEAILIRDFVVQGGNLYISGCPQNAMIQEMLGIEYIGKTKEKITYIQPAESKKFLMPDIEQGSPLTVMGAQHIVTTVNKDEIAGSIVLPYTDPMDPTIFASIHSNPPGRNTDHPAIIFRKFGRGKILWAAAAIEENKSALGKKVFLNFIKELAIKPFSFKSNAPAPVEILLFDQPSEKRYIIHVINEQEFDPLVPVNHLDISIKMDGKKAVKAEIIPNNIELPIRQEECYASVLLPQLDVYLMIALYYEEL